MTVDSSTSAHRRPTLKFPAHACDAHCHVFGPGTRFPYAEQRSYTPPDSPKEALAALHDRMGIERCVIVQGACYGSDHSALLDAIAAAPERRRGVALMDGRLGTVELEALHRGGVRGARFNFVRRLGGAPSPQVIADVTARIRPLGWHLVFHFEAGQLAAQAHWLRDLTIPFVIDHFARIDMESGMQQPDVHLLLELARLEHCWLKISAADRISVPPFHAAVPLARAILEVAPGRVLWGTDFPHPNRQHEADDADLADLVALFAPDARDRQRLLVDNPARLYGFPS